MFTLMFVVRLLMATIAGGAVGLERETSNKSAGLRTNTLVAVGACIYVLIAGRVIDGSDGDPTRIVGQIVTGIGFLGAGVILHRGTNVRGADHCRYSLVQRCTGLPCRVRDVLGAGGLHGNGDFDKSLF